MIVLGLNAFHGDSSAALVRDGRLVAAAEEERFRRIKHWAGFPSQSVAYCLQEAGLRLGDVEHVAERFGHYWIVEKQIGEMPSPESHASL